MLIVFNFFANWCVAYFRSDALCMEAGVYNLRLIRTILFVFFVLAMASCANGDVGNGRKANVSNICLGGTNCKTLSAGIIGKRIFSSNWPIFGNNNLSLTTADIDLQDIAMYNIHCKKCKHNVENKSNQQTINMYIMKIAKEKNGVPLNNIEINAVLKEYNGLQVNGFCNHKMNIVDPVLNFVSKQQLMLKDSIKDIKR